MGVLKHNRNTREAFSKVSSQVKKGGMLHIMVYDKKYDHEYDGYRGDTSIEKQEMANESREKLAKMKPKGGQQ